MAASVAWPRRGEEGSGSPGFGMQIEEKIISYSWSLS